MGTGAMIGHLLVASAVAALVLALYRWIQRQSQVIGFIVAVTVLLRLVIGQALFWISFLKLPIAPSLQRGGGFWFLALDATGYYQMAARVVNGGPFYPLDHVVPAPFFIDVLAVWMYGIGVGPASGMLLNLCLYLAIVALMIRYFAPANDWHHDLPCIVGTAAYSFAPVVLIHSTQPLKDELCVALGVVACFATIGLRPLFRAHSDPHPVRVLATATLILGFATLGITGIRFYFGFMVWCALALTLALLVVQGCRTSFLRYVAGSVAVLLVVGVAFRAASGPYYPLVGGANLDRIVASLLPAALKKTPETKGAPLQSLPVESVVIEPPKPVAALPADRPVVVEPPKAESPLSAAAALPADPPVVVEPPETESPLSAAAALPADLVLRTQLFRNGFLMSGGGTNVAVPLREDPVAGLTRTAVLSEKEHGTAAWKEAFIRINRGQLPPPPNTSPYVAPLKEWKPEQLQAARAVPLTPYEQLVITTLGLGTIFVPISVLKPLLDLEFTGGRGLLYLADLDTIFLDVATAWALLLLWQRRRYIGDRLPTVLFGLALSASTAVLLGYVVTNFGTLWRMRPLAMVPLWVLVVTLSPRREAAAASASEQPASVR